MLKHNIQYFKDVKKIDNAIQFPRLKLNILQAVQKISNWWEEPYFNTLWAFGSNPNDDNVGAIDAFQQWAGPADGITDLSIGQNIIAIIDSGVHYTHEDLAENILINKAEIPNNQIDDDQNGYTDCQDYGCRMGDFVTVCIENTEALCGDEKDNDNKDDEFSLLQIKPMTINSFNRSVINDDIP